jgi:hypothetical protein
VWDLALFSFLTPPNSGSNLSGVIDERLWWNPAGGGPLAAGSAAARDTVDLHPGQLVYRTDTGEMQLYNGAAWVVSYDPTVQPSGKMWKSGSQALTTTLDRVTMDTARVRGGVTFDDSAGTLTLPTDGMYEVIVRGSVTGAPGPLGYFAVRRTRSGSADIDWITVHFDKPDTADRAVNAVDVLPLKAGDRLSMRVVSGTVAGSARGATEYDGCVVTALARLRQQLTATD